MTKREIKDVAASVRERLLNKSRQTGRPFNELLQYYAIERFLYRLSKSPHQRKFILKGALMLAVWKAPMSRPTRDMDFLGRIDNDLESIVGAVRDMCSMKVEPDGLAFDPESLEAERIAEDADYEGVRVRFKGNIGNARIGMQFDVGFGDAVVPSAQTVEYPTILDLPRPVLIGYSMESTIAEKFEAMVKLGALNSRMKDFFDIWLLSRQFDFLGETLGSALSSTFSTRGTGISISRSVLSAEFGADPSKAVQWVAFLRRSRIEGAPREFGAVVGEISGFLVPLAKALGAGATFTKSWKAGGPWRS